MQFILEITGLGFTFIGAAILAINAYTSNLGVWIEGTMTYRLGRPIVAIVGLVLVTIGFGLQFVAALLTL